MFWWQIISILVFWNKYWRQKIKIEESFLMLLNNTKDTLLWSQGYTFRLEVLTLIWHCSQHRREAEFSLCTASSSVRVLILICLMLLEFIKSVWIPSTFGNVQTFVHTSLHKDNFNTLILATAQNIELPVAINTIQW